MGTFSRPSSTLIKDQIQQYLPTYLSVERVPKDSSLPQMANWDIVPPMHTFSTTSQGWPDQLLRGQLAGKALHAVLDPVGFNEPGAAHRALQRLAGDSRIRPSLSRKSPTERPT